MTGTLLPFDGGTDGKDTETTETSRGLSVTLRVSADADLNSLIEKIRELGEVTALSYFEAEQGQYNLPY